MATTYAEYLKANGASDEDVKALDHPIARKAWEATQVETAAAKRDRENLQKWYNDEAVPAYKKMEQDMLEAKSDAARNAAFVKAAQDQGLLEIAKKAGVRTEDLNPNPSVPQNFDASKYVTNDTLVQVAEREGDAIAIAQDIAFEHSRLFPDKPLNFRELRKEAVSRKISLEQLWMDKFGVSAARDAQAAATKDAYEKRLREEGAAAARQQFADQYGNPNTRPLSSSTSPFAARPQTGRDKQPWDAPSPETLTADRVRRGTESVIKNVVH